MIRDRFNKDKKIDLTEDLKLERKQALEKNNNEYNFVASSNHWLSKNEQEIKVNEIEKITKIKDKN